MSPLNLDLSESERIMLFRSCEAIRVGHSVALNSAAIPSAVLLEWLFNRLIMNYFAWKFAGMVLWQGLTGMATAT